MQYRPYAIARILKHEDHQYAKYDQFEIRGRIQDFGQDVLQLVFKREDQAGTQHRAPYAARAAHHRHEQVLDAVVQAKRAEADGSLHMGIQPAGQASQQGGIHKDNDLVIRHVDAERLGHAAATFQRPDGPTRTRVQQVAGSPHRQQYSDPDQVVDVAPLPQRVPEDLDGLYAGNTVVLTQK